MDKKSSSTPAADAASPRWQRRSVLGGAATGGVLAAVAWATRGAADAPPAVPAAPTAAPAGSDAAPRGYQLTEHVKRYYATARV